MPIRNFADCGHPPARYDSFAGSSGGQRGALHEWWGVQSGGDVLAGLNTMNFNFNPAQGPNLYSAPGYFDNWGFGLRIMVMGAPMRLDLGFPISDPTDIGGSSQFNFSFGTRF